MNLALCLSTAVTALIQTPIVEGLRPNETAVELASQPAQSEMDSIAPMHGRIVHGLDGRGLSGADIEVMTEDHQDPVRGVITIGRSRSRLDGSFTVASRVGALTGNKVRVSCPGFRTTVVDLSDVYEEDFPLYPRQDFKIQVVDLEGRPIVGARLESRQSCKHTPPAVIGNSGPLGFVELDDFPPMVDDPGLLVSAPGYGSIYGPDPSMLRRLAERDGVVRIHLPRRAPIDVIVQDKEGRALAGRKLVLGLSPYRSVWTDDEGRARFSSPSEDREAYLQVIDAQAKDYWGLIRVPVGETITLRGPDASIPVESDRSAVLDLEFGDGWSEDEDEYEPEIYVFHPNGSYYEGTGQHEMEPGRVRVVVGGDFTGWKETIHEVVVGKDGLRFRPIPVREPVLLLRGAAENLVRVYAQAGNDSIQLEDLEPVEGADSVAVPVPAGRPIVLFAGGGDLKLHRVILDPIYSDTVVQIDDEAHLLREGLGEAASSDQPATLAFRGRDTAGKPVSFSELILISEGGYQGIYSSDSEVETELQAGGRFEAGISTRGYRKVRLQGEVPPPGKLASFEVVFEPLARIELSGPVTEVIAAGKVWEPGEDGKVQLRSGPGPLLVTVALEDGRRIGLQLEIESSTLRQLSFE